MATFVLGVVAGALLYPTICLLVMAVYRLGEWNDKHLGLWVKVRLRRVPMDDYAFTRAQDHVSSSGLFYRGAWKPSPKRLSRWVGIGRWNGPGISVGRVRHLA